MEKHNDKGLLDLLEEPAVHDNICTAKELSPILINDNIGNKNRNNASIKVEICDAQLKINNDNDMLDSSKEPVVNDDRSATKEKICDTQLKISNDNKMLDSS